MEQSHRQQIIDRFPEASGKVFLVTELGSLRKLPVGMPDPKGEPLDVFYYQTHELERISRRVVASIKTLISGKFPDLPSGCTKLTILLPTGIPGVRRIPPQLPAILSDTESIRLYRVMTTFQMYPVTACLIPTASVLWSSRYLISFITLSFPSFPSNPWNIGAG